MKKAIIIVGPTAVGKTKLSIELAKVLNSEIISADSMQIYRGMDIGTAKVKENEKEGIKHHLIDVIDPDQNFSVNDFQEKAFTIIEHLNKKNIIPIIAGGTGLYINSLAYKLHFQKTKADTGIRKKWNKKAEQYGLSYVYDHLKKIDPDSAKRIDPRNAHRIIRAIEVYESSGRPMSTEYNKELFENDSYDFIMIGLNTDRETLYERINQRVDLMLEEGLIEETQQLIRRYDPNSHGFKAIGYREAIDYLYGKTTKDEMIHLIKRNSRRYAKRQLTWFRRDRRIIWFDLVKDYEHNYKKIENLIK